MHMILGHSADPLCGAVLAEFTAIGHDARILELTFADRQEFDLRIGTDGNVSQPRAALRLSADPDEHVDSVLVRSAGLLDPAGWSPADHAYVQSEIQAAILAWLTALDCPVVNRLGADLWYRPRNPLAYWLPRLELARLTVPEMRISTDPKAARQFRMDMEADGLPGAVCASLVRAESWLVGPTDWPGVEKLQALAPIYLVEPHRKPRSACIVGGEVIWDRRPEKALARMAGNLIRFAEIAALDFVEIVLGRVRRGWAVVDVEPVPQLFHFDGHAQARIISALIDLLQGKSARAPTRPEVLA